MLHHPFERLEEGARFVSRGRTVTEGDVHAFAAQTGDMHPQHCDAEWAARSVFGERIAHGMLVLSYAVGLVGFDPRRVLALRRISDAVFKRPVKLGDSIHDLRDRTTDLIENLRGNTETLLNSTRAAIEEKMALLNEAVEAGRKAAEYKRAELIEQEGP